jgi:tetratricopeptide (TPR) repeat protein
MLLGMIATSENEPEKTIEYNLKALKLEPGNVDAWHNMGLTYLLSDRPKEAIRCFEKALSLEERVDTRHFLEEAYEEMKD